MKDVIEFARESRLDVYGLGKDHLAFVDALQRFAVLVRADEREAWEQVCDQHLRHIAKLKKQHKAEILAEREAAVQAEREAACDIVDYELDSNGHAEAIKIAIRARGNT
jgi:hypothetical protein